MIKKCGLIKEVWTNEWKYGLIIKDMWTND